MLDHSYLNEFSLGIRKERRPQIRGLSRSENRIKYRLHFQSSAEMCSEDADAACHEEEVLSVEHIVCVSEVSGDKWSR